MAIVASGSVVQTFLYLPLCRPFLSLFLAQYVYHMLLGEAVPTHVGANQRRIDVDHLRGGDFGLQASLDRSLEILRNRSSPQRWRIRVKLEWCGSCSCRLPTNQRIAMLTRASHQLAIVHDDDEQTGEHQPYRRFRIDAGSAIVRAITIRDLFP